MLGCQFSHDFSSFRNLRWLFCYFHVPRARWVPHPNKFIPKQCSIQWASERYWFELSMRCKLWDICEKHTNIHTYIHDPSPFSIGCWTSASRLRREASVWMMFARLAKIFRKVIHPGSSSITWIFDITNAENGQVHKCCMTVEAECNGFAPD